MNLLKITKNGKNGKKIKKGVEIISGYGIISISTNCVFTIVKNSLKKRKGSNMRRNIAKVSALIMAATTAMSPMMPTATTVVMAGETTNVTDNYTFVAGTVVYDYDHIDWSNMTIPVSYLEQSDLDATVKREVKTTAAVGEFTEGLSYFSAECGVAGDQTKAHNAQVVFTLIGRAGEVLGSSEKVEIPEGITGYGHKEHNIVAQDKNLVNATHIQEGSYDHVETCTDCGYTKTTHVTIPVQGHVFVSKIDTASFVNIKVDEDGNAILGEDGLPQPADKRYNASYDVIEVCEEDGVVLKRTNHVIPVSEAEEVWVLTGVEDTFMDSDLNGTNTHFNGLDGQLFAYYYNQDEENSIWLNDCTKDGTYTFVHLNFISDDGNPTFNWDIARENVLRVETKTIKAHHYWGLTMIDPEKSSTNLKKDENGDIVAILDEDGNAISAYNTHCVDPAEVVLYHVCQNCGKAEEVETVTLEGTGKHQLKDFVKNEENPNYTPVDEDYHSFNTHRQCAICGEYFEEGTGEEEHHWAIKSENVVDSTCGFSGKYDRVVYCKDCGYEKSRQLVTTRPTDKHEYNDMFVEWTGSMYVGDWADDNDVLAVKAVAKQVCNICDGKGEDWFTGVAQTGVSELYNGDDFSYYDYDAETTKEYRILDGELNIEVGEPTKTQFNCAPATVVLKAYFTGYDANGKYVEDKLVGEHEVIYYATTAEYEARVQHVAGKTETITTEDGKTYKVTYCAVCGEEIAREEVKSEEPVETLGQVEGLKASVNANGQVEVSWNALENADGYLVVAINGKVRGQQIGYTAGTSFVDKNANAQDYNYYWVIAYQKNANGGIVKGQLTGYVYAMKPTAFTATAESTEDGVALAWEAVEGASKYIVKAKAASEKTATAIATVTGTEYVDAAASADEYTFYWVFPVYTNAAGKDVVGNASNYVFGMTK